MHHFKFLSAAILACAVLLSGCASNTPISDLAVSVTTATPTQAKTVGEATQALTILEKSLDAYVVSGAAKPAVLDELQSLVPPIHNALKKVQDANRAGNSALVATTLAAFNEALTAYNSYKTSQGIK